MSFSGAARQNPYAVLGVHPSADAWAIRRAYRNAMRACHPDIAGTDDTELATRAREVTAAYGILGDPERRTAFENNLGNILNGWTAKGISWGWRFEWCLQCGRNLHGTRGHKVTDSPHSPTYRSKRRDAAYCSNACRQKAYRARKATLKALGQGD